MCGIIGPLIRNSPSKQFVFAIIIGIDVILAGVIWLSFGSIARGVRRKAGTLVAVLDYAPQVRFRVRGVLGFAAICALCMCLIPLAIWAATKERAPGLVLFNHWMLFAALIINLWTLRCPPVELRERGVIANHFGLLPWTCFIEWSHSNSELTLKQHRRVFDRTITNDVRLLLPGADGNAVVTLLQRKINSAGDKGAAKMTE